MEEIEEASVVVVGMAYGKSRAIDRSEHRRFKDNREIENDEEKIVDMRAIAIERVAIANKVRKLEWG